MDAPTRLGSTSLTPTTARQTPRNDFGQVLERTVKVAAQVGLAVAPALGGGVVSAAVSGVSAVARAAVRTRAGGSEGPGAGEAADGEGGQWDLLEAQRLLNEEGQRFNAQYLHLQNELQRESREFNAVSNIMKVRHDSAKAAINNIR